MMRNKEKMHSLFAWIVLLLIAAFTLWYFTSCHPHYTQQEVREIHVEPQGALHFYCPDSAFMLNPDDILADYNSPSLEVVYSVDSVDLGDEEVKISPIYFTDGNTNVCVPYYWQSYDSVYGQNEFFEVKCKELYAQWVVDLDTCQ